MPIVRKWKLLFIFIVCFNKCFMHCIFTTLQIKTHLQDMYTHPATAEQCLHNALKITNAMRYAGIDYDIQVRVGISCLPLSAITMYLKGIFV